MDCVGESSNENADKSADENENRIEKEDITTSVLSIIIQDILRIVS